MKKDRDDLKWENIRSEHLVQNEWIDFRQAAFRFPDGTVFEPYYNYSRKDYVVVVPFDEEGNLICVRQFRQGLRKVTTEFPAGGIERADGRIYRYRDGDNSPSLPEEGDAEEAFDAARRELVEETGYVSDEWTHLLTVPANATLADNYAYLYIARNCKKVAGQSLDETEFVNVDKYTPEEIDRMIMDGSFEQAVHILAWMLATR